MLKPRGSPRHGATLELAISGLRLADQNFENGSSSTVRTYTHKYFAHSHVRHIVVAFFFLFL